MHENLGSLGSDVIGHERGDHDTSAVTDYRQRNHSKNQEPSQRHTPLRKIAVSRGQGNARGSDWKPPGSVLEGDVQQRMFSEYGFLILFERRWEGSSDPARVYAPLDASLRRFR